MSCSACTKTKPVPTFTQSLILGTVTPDTLFYIRIKNISTDWNEQFEATSGNDGQLALPMYESPYLFYENQIFECRVMDTTLVDEPVTIDGEEYACFQLTFDKIHTEDGLLAPEEITLEVV